MPALINDVLPLPDRPLISTSLCAVIFETKRLLTASRP